MTQYNRGDIITGTIVMIGENEVVVALGGLKEGVFPKSELNPPFKIGDAILVMVTGEIDDKGCIILKHEGVNKALEDKEKLKNLKVGSILNFPVTEINNSGIAGNYMGYRVFVPYSQTTNDNKFESDNLVNSELTAIVIEIDNIKKSIVASTKLISEDKISPISVGENIDGKVIKIEEKYAIVLLANGSKAKLSISDASYDKLDNLQEFLELHKTYTFKILDCNLDFSRVAVGLKQLMPNPNLEIYNSLHVGDIVSGEVIKILQSGAVIKLENGLNAFAYTRDNSEKSNVQTHHIFKLNAIMKFEISFIDIEKEKINLIIFKQKNNLS